MVVSDFEFPTNAQIWHAQEPRGARVVHVPRAADGYIPLEHFDAAIDATDATRGHNPRLLRNGAKLDIPGIVRLARAKGARVLLDCYQSVGSLDIDVKALDVDFAAGGMLKYLLGTAGIGFLYVSGFARAAPRATNSGWFAQAQIAAMDITANRPAPNARRFEAGTPAVVNCYAAEAGLKFLLAVGTPAVERRILRPDAPLHAETGGDRLAEHHARPERAPRGHRRRAVARQRARCARNSCNATSSPRTAMTMCARLSFL